MDPVTIAASFAGLMGSLTDVVFRTATKYVKSAKNHPKKLKFLERSQGHFDFFASAFTIRLRLGDRSNFEMELDYLRVAFHPTSRYGMVAGVGALLPTVSDPTWAGSDGMRELNSIQYLTRPTLTG
jgi:hypothetical protein